MHLMPDDRSQLDLAVAGSTAASARGEFFASRVETSQIIHNSEQLVCRVEALSSARSWNAQRRNRSQPTAPPAKAHLPGGKDRSPVTVLAGRSTSSRAAGLELKRLT
jgi:hypothetical protein